MFLLSLSENDRPTSLVPDLIDYNMPLTATYLKQMKLQCMTTTERVSASLCKWALAVFVKHKHLYKVSYLERFPFSLKLH